MPAPSNLVHQTSTGSGTGNLTLVSVNGKRSFNTAFGNGATTTRDNQQMLGTASNTYTAPGITSAASRAAQTGTTQIVTALLSVPSRRSDVSSSLRPRPGRGRASTRRRPRLSDLGSAP